MTAFLIRPFAPLVDLLLPQRCAGCAAVPVVLCDACRAALTRPPRPAWPVPRPPGLPPPWAVAAYEGRTRAVLLAYKEAGRLTLRAPLGAALAGALRAALCPPPEAAPPAPAGRTSSGVPSGPPTAPFDPVPPPPAAARASSTAPSAVPDVSPAPSPAARAPAGAAETLVVPVPSAPRALRRRGHDPVRALAETAVGVLGSSGVPVTCAPVLRQGRGVADQSGLGAAARTANLAGALRVTDPGRVRGRRVVVVDDVITSGATLAEAARALRAAGARVTAAATVAATLRRVG